MVESLDKISTLVAICNVAQIGSFLLAFTLLMARTPPFLYVLIGIGGFAAIVKYFVVESMPEYSHPVNFPAAICGFVLIILACVFAGYKPVPRNQDS